MPDIPSAAGNATVQAEGKDLASQTLTAADLRRVIGIIGPITGMVLNEGKEDLIKGRLLKRLRLLSLPSFKAYLDFVEGEAGGAELRAMVDVLTTHKTSFFREYEHFEFMEKGLLPRWRGKSLRIWSAACSSGEEPYSIAMHLKELWPDAQSGDWRILATDIAERTLKAAEAGTYSSEALAGLKAGQIAEHFTCLERGRVREYKVKPHLREKVGFARLNLMDPWPMQGPFDLIFCRNVMIYFSKETQERLVNRFHGLLRPGGFLFVGHSESLSAMDHPYRYVRPAVYQKAEAHRA
jgi:chemotaxis protein methyltransferase CheR